MLRYNLILLLLAVPSIAAKAEKPSICWDLSPVGGPSICKVYGEELFAKVCFAKGQKSDLGVEVHSSREIGACYSGATRTIYLRADKPEHLLHELAHFYGVPQEDVANFFDWRKY